MARVLVTGAGGFIGRCAVGPLLDRGYEVHTAARGGPPSDPHGAVVAHRVDLLDPDATRALVEIVRPTHLLHFAWYVAHGAFWTAPENELWRVSSLAMLDAFADVGGVRAVLAGTCAEYEWGGSLPLSEVDTPLVPATAYGASKNALRGDAEVLAARRGLELAWGRIFMLHGPGEHPDRLVPSVARAVLEGRPALCSHGRQRRDFLDVDDVAGAFVALLHSDVRGAVNIASGTPVTIAEVVELVAATAGAPELVRLGARPAPPGDPDLLVADVTRLTEEVGWRPRIDLASGIARAVEWWRSTLVSAGSGAR